MRRLRHRNSRLRRWVAGFLPVTLVAAAATFTIAVGPPAGAAGGAPDCGPNPTGTQKCDFYAPDSNGVRQLAGQFDAGPATVAAGDAMTLTATSVSDSYFDFFGPVGNSQVSITGYNAHVVDYSPKAGPTMQVIVGTQGVTWRAIETGTKGTCPGDFFDPCGGTTTGTFAAGQQFTVDMVVDPVTGSSPSGGFDQYLGASWVNTGGEGASYSGPVRYEYGPSRPQVAYDVTPNTRVPGQYVFTSNSTDPTNSALTQTWNFGDGTPTVQGPAATHTYTKPGTYHSSLTATNAGGGTSTLTKDVVVTAPTLSSSLVFIDGGGNVLPTVSPVIGDTVRVRLTLAASDNGVGSVHNITFTGDPLTLTPSGLLDLTGPSPTVPTALTLAAGESKSYVYTAAVLAAGVVRMTSTPAGTDDTGAAVPTTPAQLSFGASSIEVSLTLSPGVYEAEEDANGPKPVDITVTETIKNISGAAIDNLNIRSIDATRNKTGQLLRVTATTGVHPDTTAGYPLVGLTLAPGATSPPIVSHFTVADDGKIQFSSLVTGAAPDATTLRGFGTAILTATPQFYLGFTSRVVSPGSGLLPAGSPIVIQGTVRNLTDSDTLDVGPLFAQLEGNAGLQGLAYNGVGIDPKSLTAPTALTLDPGDTKTFTLKVLTSYSQPDGDGGVKRSGGTSATVTFTPWATVIRDDGTAFTTDAEGSQVLSTEGDLSHRVAIDDSIPIPEFSYTAAAGGIMVGGVEGVWNAASGLATGLVTLPATLAAGLHAVINVQATVWDSFTEAQKQQFSTDYWEMSKAVLSANVGLAAEGSATLFNQASQFTYQFFTKLDNDWHTGNYAQTVADYTSLASNSLAQVLLPIALGKLATGGEALDEVDLAQSKLQAKLAELTASIEDSKTIESVAGLLTKISSGTALDAAMVAKLYGITSDELEALQTLATKYRYLLTVRSRAPSSIDWLEKFNAMVKPEAIKIKSVSALDVQLGYPEKYEGALVFKEPEPLIELRKSGGQISDLVQAFVEKQGFTPGSAEYYDAIQRVADRIAEWNKYATTYEEWNQQGWVDTSFNWGGNFMADPTSGEGTDIKGFHLEPTGVDGEYVVQMYNPDVQEFVPVTGDIDPIAFTHLDGSPLTPTEHAQLLNEMRTNPHLRTQHGESATYVNGGVDFIESQFKPGEAALQIAPGGVAPRAVRFNAKQSIWNSAGDYELTWDGGFVYAGSSPTVAETALGIGWAGLAGPEVAAQQRRAQALPGDGTLNVGRCAVTYSAAPSAPAVYMDANGQLVEISMSGTASPSPLESSCFGPGPVVHVTVKPATTVSATISAGVTEVPVQTGPGVSANNPNNGFSVGQRAVISPGTPNAETGTISSFGSIIFSAPMAHPHQAGDVVLVTVSAPGAGDRAGGTSGLAATGSPAAPLVVAGGLLMLAGGAVTALSRRRRTDDA